MCIRDRGKSSVLEKMRRAGLGDHLVPVYVDLQGCENAWHFYTHLVEEIGRCVSVDPVSLPQDQTAYAVEQFLQQIQPVLAGRYLLIMIDEANCLADPARDYALLAGHLRSLMQSTEQPVVLLFCGTHALREGASDYQSILFNTCQTEYVSYLSEAEAHQVLTRPVDGFLVFDPQALALGFQLTAGQPYLLQLLGLKLIEQFDATLQRDEPRSNYVTYLDMERAGAALAQQDNAAFEDYWQSANPTMQAVLSVLAGALNEVDRTALSLTGILSVADQFQFRLSRKAVYDGLQSLVDQELLQVFDNVYGFQLPLFRRWLAFHRPVRQVREGLTVNSS